jgi:hypothetical protein
MANERLRSAMAKVQADIEAITRATGVDPRAPSKSRYAPNVRVCLPPETYLPTWINAAMWRWLVMWARTNRTNRDFDGALGSTRRQCSGG